MIPEVRSLFAAEDCGDGEIFANLLEGVCFRLEQIASFGAASEPGFWYDQAEPEWVALLRGTATLAFDSGSVDLQAGDCLLIPARLKHRVARTSEDAVWLALHYEGGKEPNPDCGTSD